MITSTERQRIAILWEQLRDAIDAAYTDSNHPGSTSHAGNLRAFARNQEWNDRTDRLLEREIAHERQHRKGHPGPIAFPIRTAAQVLILHNVANHRDLDAIDSLTIRDTAFEASVVAGLIRPFLSESWIGECMALDYARFMENPKERAS